MPRQPQHSKNWGGARRPASTDPVVKLSISLPKSLYDQINALAYGPAGESRSGVITRLLRAALAADAE